MRPVLLPVVLAILATTVACATGASSRAGMNVGNQTVTEISSANNGPNAEINCTNCTAIPIPTDVERAIDQSAAPT